MKKSLIPPFHFSLDFSRYSEPSDAMTHDTEVSGDHTELLGKSGMEKGLHSKLGLLGKGYVFRTIQDIQFVASCSNKVSNICASSVLYNVISPFIFKTASRYCIIDASLPFLINVYRGISENEGINISETFVFN